MNVTGVTVSYNTKEALQLTLDSIRRFYPDMHIIVIDGSSPGDPCFEYVQRLRGTFQVLQFGYNIGHGAGMQVGIAVSPTDNILIFDSDIEMHRPPVDAMLQKMEGDTFGVGQIVKVKQEDYGIHLNREGAVPVLHPHFHLINRKVYRRFMPYVQSGGPTCLTMIDIFNRGMDHVLKEFPVADYVLHHGKGTRKIKPVEPVPEKVRISDYFS